MKLWYFDIFFDLDCTNLSKGAFSWFRWVDIAKISSVDFLNGKFLESHVHLFTFVLFLFEKTRKQLSNLGWQFHTIADFQ